MMALLLINRLLLLVTLTILSGLPSCWAGTISFGLTRTADQLVLTNLGNSSAYYPAAFRLRVDGRWQALPVFKGAQPMAELPAQAVLKLQWTPVPQHLQAFSGTVTPILIRFFDQAGASQGQLTFFNQPPPMSSAIEAAYRNGQLVLAPPAVESGVAVSWLLWAKTAGITALNKPVRFSHTTPAVSRIVWQSGVEQRFDLGVAQPGAMLLHQTPQGLRLQTITSGGLQGNRQRAYWLQAGEIFYWLALGCGITASVLLFATALPKKLLPCRG
jgi:hypothetical protein